MQSLKNKKKLAVKFKDESGNYLVACDDRKSIKGTQNPTPPETAQWIIKGKDPEKRVQLVSIYNTFLAAEGVTSRLIQTDKFKEDLNRSWRLEETEKGFPKVYLRPSQQNLGYYLMSSYEGKVKWDYLSNALERWICKGMCRWEVKVLNNPKPFIEKEEAGSSSSINSGNNVIQIGQQVNYNGGAPEISSVNSGRNVNYGPGNQFNGGINIRNEHRGRIVNIIQQI